MQAPHPAKTCCACARIRPEHRRHDAIQGHLGRQVKVWPDPVIFREVIVPWLARTLRVDGSEAGRER